MARGALFLFLALLLGCNAVLQKKCAPGKRCPADDDYDYTPPAPTISPVQFVPPAIGATLVVGPSPGSDSPRAYLIGGSLETPESCPEYLRTYLRTPGYENNLVSDGLYVFDLERYLDFIPSTNVERDGQWDELNIPRSFHVATATENFLWVWGGGSQEIERYDIQNDQWHFIAVDGIKPTNRFGSSARRIGNTWYVFGGIQEDPSKGILSNELWAFDFNELSWSIVNDASGDAPLPRVGASLTRVHDEVDNFDYLVLFGGTDNNGTAFNDLWYFFPNSGEWVQPALSTINPPPGRYGHAAGISSGELIITLGDAENVRDVWRWNFNEEKWSVETKQGHHTVPAPRVGFSYISMETTFLFFGGVSWDARTGKCERVLGDIFATNIEPSQQTRLRWSFLHVCYPGYAYDFPFCVPEEAVEECESCEDCSDFSAHRRNYVGGLREKLIAGDYSGHLRQCPAFWRTGTEYPVHSK